MIDVRIQSHGDFDIDADGDLMLTGYPLPSSEEIAVCVAQMAYMAVKTDKGDYTLQGSLGNELKKIIGLPNKPATSKTGETIIKRALEEWSIKNPVQMDSWPEDQNTIGYEISIAVSSPRRWVKLTLQQILDDADIEVE